MSHTSTENRIPTKEILLPGQEFCIGLPWEREQLPVHGKPLPPPKPKAGNALDQRVLGNDPCEGWEIGPCTVIRRLSPDSARNLLAVRDCGPEGEAVVVMRRIDLADVLGTEVQSYARWAAQFGHKALARVYDCEVSEEGIFWVTALPSGATLGEIFAACKASGRGIPVGLALSTVYEAARGLADLHASGGAAHALVSDQSVSVSFDGAAKLSDVGLFRCLARKSSWADFLEGMGPYLAPEQVLEGRMPDPKTDVFSLAVVLYECLAGEKVMRARDFEARVKLHQQRPFKPVSTLNMALGGALDAVLARALSPDRKERFPTAREFAAALQQAGSAFMWQTAQRQRFVSGLFPDRLRRERVLLDSANPEVRPRVATRRVPTQQALKVVVPPALPPQLRPPPLPPPLPRRAAPAAPALARPAPVALPAEAKPVARAAKAPKARPAAQGKKAKAPPSKWRAFFLFLMLLGSSAGWVYQSGITWKQVDHAAWKIAKQIPSPEQLEEKVRGLLARSL